MLRWILPFIVYLILSPEFSRKALASTLFAPDSDTALLFQLVSTTASQLNELEQLVTNAQKHTEQMEKYNQISQDHYFRAERIHYIAQSYIELSGRDPNNLGDLNAAIRALKSETESLKFLIDDYRASEASNELAEREIARKAQKTAREVAFANHQLKRTGNIQSTNQAQKLTAQNTGLIYKSQVESNQIGQAMVSKLSEQNKFLSRQLKDENKTQLQKEKYYNLQDRRSLERRGERGGAR
jgi:hypothetical protein